MWHLVVLIGLWVIGVYWEFRKQKPRTVLRAIAVLLTLISLYVIYLSPFVLTEKSLRSTLIVSQEIPTETIDSLRQSFELTTLKQQGNSHFRKLENDRLVSLKDLEFQVDTAYIYGYIPHLNPDYHRVRQDINVQKGIQLNYPKAIALGDSLQIKIENLENREITISAFIDLDSISKPIGNKSSIILSHLPKAAGFVLVKISTDDSDYHFAVKVKKRENYVIQILSAVPDFEWKFFAEYLKSKEHSVYQKSQISRGEFKSTFLNWHDSLKIDRGVANDLKVLFADAKAWEKLNPSNQQLFLDKLADNRGSLIFRTNPNSKIELGLGRSIPTKIFSTSDNFLESNNYKYLQFNNLRALNEVAENAIFRKVDHKMIFGVINFQNSFQMKLSGKDEEYEQLWLPVFDELIRESNEVFYDKTKWPVQYQPFFLRLWNTMNVDEIQIITAKADTISLSSKNDYLFPERQHFMFYPKEVGWHFVQLNNYQESIPFYVHSETLTSHSEFLYNYNYDYLKYLNFDNSRTQKKTLTYNRKSVTIWFFVMFLMSVAYLWIEDKIT
ncbi:hypothetical protein [uncultured Marivirga sp.]|uniref:hypothetical protein n=1 Tax=uncultured Marivirga sp. TaxID=1123707 RepID=UPI0030EBF900